MKYRKLRSNEKLRQGDEMQYNIGIWNPINKEVIGFPAGYWIARRPVKKKRIKK
jgi:hypothetical protein